MYDHNCRNCSGDIVAIKIIYGCEALLENIHVSNKSALDLSPEYDVSMIRIYQENDQFNILGTFISCYY